MKNGDHSATNSIFDAGNYYNVEISRVDSHLYQQEKKGT